MYHATVSQAAIRNPHCRHDLVLRGPVVPWSILPLLFLFTLGALSPAAAAPVRVRWPEGVARGFVVARSLEGAEIGHGELQQTLVGRLVDSRLTLRFKDGSSREEQTLFSQAGVFRLERYRLQQQGRSFPGLDATLDRKTGRYTAATREKPGGAVERASGKLSLPADLYPGLTVTLIRNLTTRADTTVQTVAFTPEPRLLKMTLHREAEELISIAGQSATAIRYLVKLELGGLTGVVAPLLGKEPPALHYWVIGGAIPVFARFEGPMFLNGPVWRVEQALPRWPQ